MNDDRLIPILERFADRITDLEDRLAVIESRLNLERIPHAEIKARYG